MRTLEGRILEVLDGDPIKVRVLKTNGREEWVEMPTFNDVPTLQGYIGDGDRTLYVNGPCIHCGSGCGEEVDDTADPGPMIDGSGPPRKWIHACAIRVINEERKKTPKPPGDAEVNYLSGRAKRCDLCALDDPNRPSPPRLPIDGKRIF